MKRILFSLIATIGLTISLTTANAQISRLGKVTKITSSTTTVAGVGVSTIAFDDTTSGFNLRRTAPPYRRHNVLLDFTGTGTGAGFTARDISGALIYKGKLSTVRVVGATSQTDSLKIVYLKANGF